MFSKQDIVVDFDVLKQSAINASRNFTKLSQQKALLDLIYNLQQYHLLILDYTEKNDNNSIWIKQLYELYELLREYEFGQLVRDIIDQNLTQYMQLHEDWYIMVDADENPNEIEYENLVSNSYYKLYLSNSALGNKNYKYNLDQFNNREHYRKNCILLRPSKSIQYVSNDDVDLLFCLAPYIRNSKSLKFIDKYLFKSFSDCNVISHIISYCTRLEKMEFQIIKKNKEQNKIKKYLNDKTGVNLISFSDYNFREDHYRAIITDEFSITLDNSFNNFIITKDSKGNINKITVDKGVKLTFDLK